MRDEGLSTEADRLYVLLHKVAWTTGSELIGELGQALKKIEKEALPTISANSAQKIEDCFKMVHRMWPDFPQ